MQRLKPGTYPVKEVIRTWVERSKPIYRGGKTPDVETEPLGYEYRKMGYSIIQDSIDGDLLILKSPFFNGETYCLGAEWFVSGKPPYEPKLCPLEMRTGQAGPFV